MGNLLPAREAPNDEQEVSWFSSDPSHTANMHFAVFKRHREELVAATLEPLHLAQKLCREDLISEDLLDGVYRRPTEKLQSMFTSVEANIRKNPAHFWTFVRVLEGDTTLKTFAERLRGSYGQLCLSVPGALTSSSPIITPFADYLLSYYKTSRLAPDKKLYLASSREYITPTIIQRDLVNCHQFTAAANVFHERLDRLHREVRMVSLENLLKPSEGQESVKYVLVEGTPGVGKTSFAWELCRMSREVEATKGYTMVLLLNLREKPIPEAVTVSDLFQWYHYDRVYQRAVAEEVIAREGAQTLFVLDGFDEVCEFIANTSPILGLLKGICLPKATVVVTTRPSARAQVLSLCNPQVSKHVEIIGFHPDQITRYLRSVFSEANILFDDFVRFVSSDPAIGSTIHVPLDCAILTEIFRAKKRADESIPCTMTELYNDLAPGILRRHLRTKGHDSLNLLSDGLDNLPEGLHLEFPTLIKLAYQGLVEQAFVFPSLPKGCGSLDVVSPTTELYTGNTIESSCSFVHLTLQEYLAAVYISRLTPAEQIAAFQRSSSDVCRSRLNVVWRFLAGLTGFKDIGWELVVSRRGLDEAGRIQPFLVQCLYEAHNATHCQTVFGDREARFGESNQCSAIDHLAVGYCVSNTKCSWDLHLGGSQVGPDSIQLLAEGISSKVNVFESVVKLSLSGTHITEKSFPYLKRVLHRCLQRISYLNLSSCTLDKATFDLLSVTVSGMCSMKELDLSFNRPGPGGLVKLLLALRQLSGLEVLRISHVNIGYDDIQALSGLLQFASHERLTSLDIGDESISTTADSSELMNVLFSLSSPLETVRVFGINLVNCGNCLNYLNYNTRLNSLSFVCCQIGPRSFSALANALSTLDTLHIDFAGVPVGSQIGSEGAVALSQNLKANKSLKVLRILNDRSIGEAGAWALVSALEFNATLSELTLPHSYASHFASTERDPRVRWL